MRVSLLLPLLITAINFNGSQQSNKTSSGLAEAGAGTLYFLTNKATLDFSIRYRAGLDFPIGRDQTMGSSVGLKVFLGGK